MRDVEVAFMAYVEEGYFFPSESRAFESAWDIQQKIIDNLAKELEKRTSMCCIHRGECDHDS